MFTRSRRLAFALVALGQVPALVSAQTPAAPAAPDDNDRVVQLGVTLVQLDAVVTDQQGRLVTDLTAGDFEVIEDDAPQTITDFSYVANPSAGARGTATTAPSAPGPAPELRPEDVRRTVVVVVDSMSFEDTAYARYSLRKFIENDMQPGDLVSIVHRARAPDRSSRSRATSACCSPPSTASGGARSSGAATT